MPFLPFGKKCQETPKARNAFSANCQLYPLNFKYKSKVQILRGSSLFTLNKVWLPMENGERKYKIP
jgi:hypothetical protein